VSDDVINEKAWQVILNDTRRAIKAKWQSENDPMRIKYHSVVSHLEDVKTAWRNPTIHLKVGCYTERQAEKILQAVQAFVEDFSIL